MSSELSMQYAGFWKRYFALMVDSIIIIVMLWICFFVLTFLVSIIKYHIDNITVKNFISIIDLIVSWGIILLLPWIYFSYMESSKHQATLGKMALGIIVVDKNGNKISFGGATGRFLGKIISYAILLIGYIMVAFTQNKQGLHDILSGTYVINK
ncbi:RDD family protein [Desulfofustis glycolicus]|uniref:RDD family protein n=1 Tax=Desulfofustis glycolicus TaxID=51195 RepID=UPI000A016998|nr:RDD family protein [Desulfofustis glycolicus]